MSVYDMLPDDIMPESFQGWSRRVSEEIDGFEYRSGIDRVQAEVDTIDPLRVWVDGEAVDAINISNRPVQSGDEVWVDVTDSSPPFIVGMVTRRGWEPLPSGYAQASGPLIVSVPTNQYYALRVAARGNLGGDGMLGFQLNQAFPAENYRTSYKVYQPGNDAVINSGMDIGEYWFAADWSRTLSNIFECTIYGIPEGQSPSFQGTGYRAARGTDTNRQTTATGHCSGNTTDAVNRIRFFGIHEDILNLEVWVEGLSL